MVESRLVIAALLYLSLDSTAAAVGNHAKTQNVTFDKIIPTVPMTDRSCYKEVPAVLLLEKHFQVLQGNGSSIYFVKLVVCCEGYSPYKYLKNKCVPDCGGRKCANGVCTSPGVCECYPGFAKSLDGECVETCPLSCLNGKCHSNGTCKCQNGFKLDSKKQFCEPVCNPACLANQNCTAPNHCTCLEGYRMDDFGECEFSCQKDCLHGNCTGPNTCECNLGYYLKNEICQSNCTQLCDNGNCVAPNRCVCHRGYTYDHHTTICLPKCKKCVNGVCIAPGCCKCYKDFKKVNGICTHKRKISE